jgi:hypothetical protein
MITVTEFLENVADFCGKLIYLNGERSILPLNGEFEVLN